MRPNAQPMRCPLCGGNNIDAYFKDTQREYLRCVHCQLVFVPRRFWLSPKSEQAVYDLHENDATDEGYRKFLSRLTKPLLEKLEPHQKGLDFGCGPGPALPVLMSEHGHRMDQYDPLYSNDTSVFHKQYDFICATEVVEHLRRPDSAFVSLFNILKPGGWLGIMTKLVIDRQAFRQWHYIRDPTHICFYRRSTFIYIAKRFNATLEIADKDVLFLNKKC